MTNIKYDVKINFPKVEKAVKKTPYADVRKLGTVTVINDKPIFCVGFIHKGGYRKDVNPDFLDYNSLKESLNDYNNNPIYYISKEDGNNLICNYIESNIDLWEFDDYLLNYGVDASFAIGNIDEDLISISARSKEKVNVGDVMHELEGGGNQFSGATKLTDCSIEEAEKRRAAKPLTRKEVEKQIDENVYGLLKI